MVSPIDCLGFDAGNIRAMVGFGNADPDAPFAVEQWLEKLFALQRRGVMVEQSRDDVQSTQQHTHR